MASSSQELKPPRNPGRFIGAIFGNDKQKTEPSKAASAVTPSPIEATLVEKRFSEKQFGEAFNIALQFKNMTGKDVRAFDGELIFKDLLGNEILSSGIAINEALSKGGSLVWNGTIDYNQFRREHDAFRAAELENIKTQFVLSKVLFVDGELKEY